MGNVSSRRKNLKFVTQSELLAEDGIPYPAAARLIPYTGTGDTWEDAVDNLRWICRIHYFPELQQVNGVWCCGTIDIQYWFRVKRRLNVVWCRVRNGKYYAYIYYPFMK